MASVSLNFSLVIVETDGAAFFEMLSVLGRGSRFKLRRFSTVGLTMDPTTSVLNLGFAVTGITFSSATRRADLDGCFVFTDLRCGRGLWRHFLVGFLAPHVLLFGCRVAKFQP